MAEANHDAPRLALPRLGFGAAAIGGWFARVDAEATWATVAAPLKGRISFLDTAPHYGRGLSERRLGDAILLAGRYTLLEQEPLDSPFPQCEAVGVQVIVGGPYNSGVLATAGRGGAGLDVYEDEPKVHPGLLAHPYAVPLPHLGSATIEARSAMGMRAAAKLAAFFRGEEPADRVA
ncbi:hypothetical protein [Stakelama pacifica]|uniref:NADP-dependent oxidoreductase domain-containing protein n=1 Tax=Stakelama pacifica TaxID=517720 RepID=A0A4R6FD01_9SPHN|nr:hypothetical protein EV664_11439 [Stakelama pacifica]GGO98894.1 hypothetical protein GCM10011329_31120 [Stakelama pacifica]